MSDIAIRANRLTKSYKLYDAPRHRLLDILGFNRAASTGIKQHHALSDVSFEIKKGEKVAIIGRNGAGKSTLLKLITKVISPTSGMLDVRGETRALLSLGTGFHPEFTGRENARAYLASLGFSGATLDSMIREAIAFAELDDYADQPIKTYSTGMAMRLMFAAATMMKPELLVIDEVLGVGDAYFQQKSFQHISAICAAQQTTLLLVTHDIYNAAQLCDRMIWIDRGRLLIDADPTTVMRAYQDSIREQEERRLRAKALNRTRDNHTATRILLDIQSVNNQAPPEPFHVARISLLVRGVQIASAPLGVDAFESSGPATLIAEGSNWSEPAQFNGRLARALKDHGSPFHKATAAFDMPLRDGDRDHLSARIEYWSDAAASFHVKIYSDDFERDLGLLPISPCAWNDATIGDGIVHSIEENTQPEATLQSDETLITVAAENSVRDKPETQDNLVHASISDQDAHKDPAATLQDDAVIPPPADNHDAPHEAEPAGPDFYEDITTPPSPLPDHATTPPTSAEPVNDGVIHSISPSLNVSGIYGTGDIELQELRIQDSHGRERYVYEAGEAVTFALYYRIRRKTLREKLHIVMAFKRDGVTDVMRLFENDILFDGEEKREGTLHARFAQLPLGVGRYEITVLAAREGYYDEMQTVFFSMNPGVYAARMAMAEIIVESSSQLYGGTGAIVPADWRLI